jgi:histidyl-tRNA synthetase
MYTFEDKGGRSLTLRPEATAPICRAYVQHGLHREPQPQKLYTLGSMYRYSAPQKGRYREHWQVSVEAVGSDDPALDAEVIQLYDAWLGRLGITDYRLELNSIGDRNCRPAYIESLTRWLDDHDGELDDETRAKRVSSPLRVFDNFDTKPADVRSALSGAPKIGESLCDPCREHFATVCRLLDAYGVAYELVPTLVRGLDYYTRTTWEFVGPALGAQSTLSGGGRYDYLVEEIGGPPTPGVGFGAGIERLLLALEEAGVEVEAEGIDVFFGYSEGADRPALLAQMAELRRAGWRCDAEYAGRSKKGQLTQAKRLNARFLVKADSDGATIASLDGPAEEPAVPVGEVARRLLELGAV